MVKGFRDLMVWQKAMELSRAVYKLQKGLPKEETYVMARGSLYEVETQLELAESMGYLSVPSDIRDGLAEVGRMLTGFISKLHAH